MKRFFGGKKEAPPPLPSLTDATDTVNKRVGSLDDKIKALDKQLVDYKNQIKATRPGPAQNRIKQRAMQVLKQKRMYEQQRDQVSPCPFSSHGHVCKAILFPFESLNQCVVLVMRLTWLPCTNSWVVWRGTWSRPALRQKTVSI